MANIGARYIVCEEQWFVFESVLIMATGHQAFQISKIQKFLNRLAAFVTQMCFFPQVKILTIAQSSKLIFDFSIAVVVFDLGLMAVVESWMCDFEGQGLTQIPSEIPAD